eukprot:5405981-Pleurochrysis_carterae.AAC.1
MSASSFQEAAFFTFKSARGAGKLQEAAIVLGEKGLRALAFVSCERGKLLMRRRVPMAAFPFGPAEFRSCRRCRRQRVFVLQGYIAAWLRFSATPPSMMVTRLGPSMALP